MIDLRIGSLQIFKVLTSCNRAPHLCSLAQELTRVRWVMKCLGIEVAIYVCPSMAPEQQVSVLWGNASPNVMNL